MDDDGGIQWWAQLGAQEIAEFEVWLDEQGRELLTEREASNEVE